MINNKPLHTIHYGAVRLSIWANPTSLGVFYHATATRSYKKDEEWRETYSFTEFDLPILAKALLDAHTWIQTHKTTDRLDIALPPPPGPPGDDSGYGE
jgi:hypothetical protein